MKPLQFCSFWYLLIFILSPELLAQDITGRIEGPNLGENGNQIYPNPTYGEPTSFQPQMSLRFGLEIDF
jgi:hypothetical protein